MSDDNMKAELERLRRENEALKKGASDGIRMKPFGRVDETMLKPAPTTKRNPESAGIFLAHAVDAYLAP